MNKCRGCGCTLENGGFCSNSCYMSWYRRKALEARKALRNIWNND
jgi:hypothetical protein